MPRRNRRKNGNGYLPPRVKPKGGKRPRRWHRGMEQDERFAVIERRLREAEGGA